MTRSALASMATIDDFVNTVGTVKAASEKAADAPKSEPGSIGGETSHPVKSVDDRLKEVPEGERSKENTKDVKDAVGAPSVENAAEASTKNAAAQIFKVAGNFAKKAEGAVSTPGSAADDHISTTTKVAPTGEDPSSETSSAKAGKEDKKQGNMGGTSHPASTENSSLDGHKYAADTPLEKLAADMRTSGNNLLAALHTVYQSAGAVAPTQTKTAAAAAPAATQPALDPRLAYMAGNELAGLIGGTLDKRAADQMVQDTLAAVIKQAADDADMFTAYARDFIKRAEGEEGAETDPSAGGGGGEEAAASGGGGAPGGGGGEEAMMAALGGGAGGDPMGGGGGAPGGAPGGDPMGGGGGGDAEAQQLAQILEQLGVTPEELEAALAAQMGGGGAPGGDPMGGAGGGAPPGGDPMAAMGGAGGGAPPPGGMETQANAGGRKQNASFAGLGVKQAEVANVIREIVTRSRARR